MKQVQKKQIQKHENGSFQGYSARTLEFLGDLHENNNKPWFEEHKALYTEHVLKPTQDLVWSLSDYMLGLDPYLETAPAVGKTISRVYRDTRFSKDKSPLRSLIWLTFKRPRKEWIDAPAFFFELAPASYRYGMGFYSAEKGTMDLFRQMIDEDQAAFRKAISFYTEGSVFALEGDRYKKLLDPSRPEDLQEWYQRKNLYVVCNRQADERIFGPELADDLRSGFGQLKNLYDYLWKVKGRKDG